MDGLDIKVKMSSDEEKSEDNFDENDSDDESPEDISLSNAKKSALERQKQEQETIRHAKELKKNKRKQHEEKLSQQKNTKKLKNLDKLPENVLEALSAQSEKLVESSITEDAENVEGKQLYSNPSGEMEEQLSEEDEENSGESDEEPNMQKIIAAHILDSKEKECRNISQQGREFLKNHLYGDRIKRVSSSSIKYSKASKMARPHAKF